MYKLFVKNKIDPCYYRISQIISIIVFILLPFLYGYKMETGMEKVDLYFFWIIGMFAWFRLQINAFDRVAILLGTLLLLAVSTAIFHSTTDVNSSKILITLFFSFSIFCYIRSHPSVSDNISWIIVPSLFCQLSLGYWQFVRFNAEPLMIKGSLFNSGYFANWLAPCALLLLGYLCMNSDRSKRNLLLSRFGLYILFFATVFLLFATQARAALLGCLAGSIFILWIHCRIKYQRQWKVWFTVVTSFVVITICAWFFMIKQNSAIGRLTIYEVTWHMIRDHLFLGVGSNRFQAYYNIYQAQHFQSAVSQLEVKQLAGNTFEAFNFILQWWAEYGLISIIGGGFFFYFFIRECVKLTQKENKISPQQSYIAASICLFCSGLFSNPFHCSATFLLFISLLASMGRYDRIRDKQSKLSNARYFSIFLKVPCIILSIYFLYFGMQQWNAEIQWKRASSFARFGSIELAKPLYAEAYKKLKNDGRFLYNYGTELAQANEYDLSLPMLERASLYYASSNLSMYLGLDYFYTGNYKAAERSFLDASYTVPSALLPKYQLVQLYLKTKRKADARRWISYTLSYPIKIKDEISDKIIEELKAIHLE